MSSGRAGIACRALRVEQQGKSVAARIVESRLPQRNADEVLIEIRYSSINYKDALAITGRGRIMQHLPLTAGIDASGVVLESDDERFKPGQPVLVTGYELSQSHDGGLAHYLQAPADWVVPLPAGLDLFEAMALGTAGFTAGLSIIKMLDNEQTPDMGPMIVTGATGGVGSIAIDSLSALGFKVVALTGKAQTSGDYLRALGATDILDRKSLVLGKKPLESAQWGGALDAVGGEVLDWLTRTVNPRGNIASYGLAGGHEIHTTVMPFILRGINLLGINSAATPMPIRLRVWSRLAGDMKPRHLDRIVTQVISLDEVIPVCEKMMAGEIHGRYVVEIKK
ncbi:MAG TPA: YhdH/YhfP family quinone oxidoreductase [Gammaproteobacteria bacterium]|nr:YhdH/YhfP family quinone oxidoreductase [Gammaproteobacteria bacterium]